jgi:ubiquinone biosynthesis protein UbiJ|nr:MAG TPA: hypothetical protein [Caudoviricetes sp.]DAZ61114.1 MAG TPA: hypothetical protein [Caudoviricetes sp.]
MTNEEKILELLEAQGKKLDTVSQEISKINLTLENEIRPNMQAMAENISSINKKLITRDEIDSMKEEIAFLKDIIRMHTNQINDLKKAQ